jgi:hypothetical protein
MLVTVRANHSCSGIHIAVRLFEADPVPYLHDRINSLYLPNLALLHTAGGNYRHTLVSLSFFDQEGLLMRRGVFVSC